MGVQAGYFLLPPCQLDLPPISLYDAAVPIRTLEERLVVSSVPHTTPGTYAHYELTGDEDQGYSIRYNLRTVSADPFAANQAVIRDATFTEPQASTVEELEAAFVAMARSRKWGVTRIQAPSIPME